MSHSLKILKLIVLLECCGVICDDVTVTCRMAVTFLLLLTSKSPRLLTHCSLTVTTPLLSSPNTTTTARVTEHKQRAGHMTVQHLHLTSPMTQRVQTEGEEVLEQSFLV